MNQSSDIQISGNIIFSAPIQKIIARASVNLIVTSAGENPIIPASRVNAICIICGSGSRELVRENIEKIISEKETVQLAAAPRCREQRARRYLVTKDKIV